MNTPIYLDYAATTPMAPEAVEAMLPYITKTGTFANPSASQHCFGEAAEAVVEQARNEIAELLRGKTKDFVFTSGATESNNLAIKGIAQTYKDGGKHIITTAIEHKSVLDTCKYLETQGFSITYFLIMPLAPVIQLPFPLMITADAVSEQLTPILQ